MNKTARTQLVRTCDSSLAKGEIIRQLDDKVYRYFISSKVSEDIKPDETSIIKELIQFVRDNSSEIWHHPVIDNITDMPYTLSQLLKFSYLEDIALFLLYFIGEFRLIRDNILLIYVR